eukprot:6035018-Amphidinium_carterae.7
MPPQMSDQAKAPLEQQQQQEEEGQQPQARVCATPTPGLLLLQSRLLCRLLQLVLQLRLLMIKLDSEALLGIYSMIWSLISHQCQVNAFAAQCKVALSTTRSLQRDGHHSYQFDLT